MISKVTFIYEALQPDGEGLHTRDFRVAVNDARSRPAANGHTLAAARDLLSIAGYQYQTTAVLSAGHGANARKFLETWGIPPLPPAPRMARLSTRVQYNPRSHRYEVISDTTGATLGDADTHLDAEWVQLQCTDPDLANDIRRFLERYPDQRIITRALRAGLLIAAGAVSSHDQGPVYTVASQTHHDRAYRVDLAANPWSCTVEYDLDPDRIGEDCPDIQNGAPDLGHGKRCKHMAAAFIALKRQERASTALPAKAQAESPVTETRRHDTTPTPDLQTVSG